MGSLLSKKKVSSPVQAESPKEEQKEGESVPESQETQPVTVPPEAQLPPTEPTPTESDGELAAAVQPTPDPAPAVSDPQPEPVPTPATESVPEPVPTPAPEVVPEPVLEQVPSTAPEALPDLEPPPVCKMPANEVTVASVVEPILEPETLSCTASEEVSEPVPDAMLMECPEPVICYKSEPLEMYIPIEPVPDPESLPEPVPDAIIMVCPELPMCYAAERTEMYSPEIKPVLVPESLPEPVPCPTPEVVPEPVLEQVPSTAPEALPDLEPPPVCKMPANEETVLCPEPILELEALSCTASEEVSEPVPDAMLMECPEPVICYKSEPLERYIPIEPVPDPESLPEPVTDLLTSEAALDPSPLLDLSAPDPEPILCQVTTETVVVNDASEEKVSTLLKQLDLKENGLVSEHILNDMKIPDASPIMDISASPDLM